MAAPVGNQNAAKCKLVHDELRKLVIQDDGKRLRKGLDKVLTAFEAGEPWAAQFVRDTLDGKPPQSVTLTGDDEVPVIAAIRMVIVSPPEMKTVIGEAAEKEATPTPYAVISKLPPGVK